MQNIKRFFLVFCLFFSLNSFGQSAINDFNIPRLSPLPAAVTGVEQSRISLNGKWDFQVLGHAAKRSINVPSEWEMQGFTVNEGETALYSLKLDIPADWKGQRIKIRFDGVSSHALVKVNNTKVGEHEGSFVPFEVDITNALKPSDNILQVEVQALTISDRLACTSQYAVHTVGGLLRKVVLFAVPQTNIASTVTTTTFDPQFKNAVLKVQSGIANESALSALAQLQYVLTDAAGKVIFQKLSAIEKDVAANTIANTQTAINVKQPEQWNPEHPYLYHLKSTLLVSGKVVQSVSQNLGFRQVEVKGNQLLVNGKAVKLHGVCRHSIYPLTGRSVDPGLDRKDAELFRNANCNYIRTSHYPPSEEFLNAADELGLFVESEASLCWINHGASLIWKKWDYKDERFLPYMVNADVENVLAGRNHPSVIIWSLGNESVWSPLWEKVNEIVKKLDTSRPTAFQDQLWGGFNNAGSKADIANYHYPDLEGSYTPAATDTSKRPVMFDEYAHLPDYDRRALLTDPGERTAYNDPLIRMYDSIYVHKANLGGAIWSGIDDIFHLPNGQIVGYGPWGPIDAWRRPKPEYWGMKKAYSPIRVIKINTTTAPKGYIELSVENRYNFISLSEINITVDADNVSKNISANIPARGQGIIKIPVPGNAQSAHLSFKDPRGFIADDEFITIRKKQATKNNIANNATFTESESAILVKQNGITYNIAKETGLINGIRKGDQVLVTQGPVFTVSPLNADEGGKPTVDGETYQNDIYPLKNYPLIVIFAKNVTVTEPEKGIVKISMDVFYYDGSKNNQTYTFKNGEMITNYELTYKNSQTNPYQYGLLLQLPKSMDKLAWDREPGRTVYPETDISRWQGTTMLNAKHVNGVEEWGVVPKGDWKDDAMDMGCSDFRSTKRHIYTASLSNKNGESVTALSNGEQYSRSWLQDEHIQWLIADFSNHGSEYYSLINDRVDIKNKILKGQLRLLVE